MMLPFPNCGIKKLQSCMLTPWILALKWYRQNMSLEKIYFAIWIRRKLPGVRGGLCNPSYWDGGIWGWLVDREPPKGSKWPAEGPHYTWGLTRGGAHTRVPPGADWIPICLGPRGCLVCWARRWVRSPAAAVLGLTRPREVGTFVLFPDVRQNP